MSVQWLVQGSFFFPVLKSEHLTIPVCRVSHLHSAFCQHWKLSPWKTQSKTKQKKRKKAQLSVFTSLKPQQQKKWRFLSAFASTAIRFNEKKLSVVEVKGYGRVLFVRIFEKKTSLFSAHCCLLLCSCAFSVSPSCLQSSIFALPPPFPLPSY